MDCSRTSGAEVIDLLHCSWTVVLRVFRKFNTRSTAATPDEFRIRLLDILLLDRRLSDLRNDGRYKLVVPSASAGRSGTDFELAEAQLPAKSEVLRDAVWKCAKEEIRDFSAVYVALPSKLGRHVARFCWSTLGGVLCRL